MVERLGTDSPSETANHVCQEVKQVFERLADAYADRFDAEILQSATIVLVADAEQERGHILPTVSRLDFEVPQRMRILIEPESISDFAEVISPEDTEDITRLLIGTGLAKIALGTMMYRGTLMDDRSSMAHEMYERSVDKSSMWQLADECDDVLKCNRSSNEPANVSLRALCAKMRDADTVEINWVRFAAGLSLRTFFPPDRQQELLECIRQHTLEELAYNERQYLMDQQWMDMDLAIDEQMKTLPRILIGLSLPMSPQEEVNFLARV